MAFEGFKCFVRPNATNRVLGVDGLVGRQKGRHLNVAAKKLLHEFPDKFSTDFEENKKRFNELEAITYSKEERNKLAGAITVIVLASKSRTEE